MTNKVIINKDEIDYLETEAQEFLKKIFFLENVLVTDLTDLSDFTFSGFSPEQSELAKSMEPKEMTAYWDKLILSRIKEVYGIELKTVCVNLLLVLHLIEDAKKTPTIQ